MARTTVCSRRYTGGRAARKQLKNTTARKKSKMSATCAGLPFKNEAQRGGGRKTQGDYKSVDGLVLGRQ